LTEKIVDIIDKVRRPSAGSFNFLKLGKTPRGLRIQIARIKRLTICKNEFPIIWVFAVTSGIVKNALNMGDVELRAGIIVERRPKIRGRKKSKKIISPQST